MVIRSSKVTWHQASMMGGAPAYTSSETLIVWTESGGTDMALSFQESEGCASIWYAI